MRRFILKKSYEKLLFIVITIAGVISSQALYAGDTELLKLIEVLRENGTIDSVTAKTLQDSIMKKEKKEATDEDGVKMSLKDGKPGVKTADNDFKFGIHGRLMTDYAWYDDDKTDLGNGGEVRRARIALKGSAWENWHFHTQYDFVNSESSSSGHLRTVDLKYTGIQNWQLQGGHFHQPFGMERQSSSKTITFMERALPDAFVPSRDLGLAAQYLGGMWRAKAGLFSIVDFDGDDTVADGDASWAISLRLNATPIHEKRRVLHFGVAGAYRDLEDSSIRFRTRPESHVTDIRLVDTGGIGDATDFSLIGFEAAFKHGPFSLMGEHMRASVDRDNKGDLDFDGSYVQASYVLTGESRSYKRKTGTWGGVTPESIVGKNGWGAWEVATRFSNLDLTDDDIIGGEEDNLSFSINWYLTPQIRFNANYVKVLELERPGNLNDGNEPQLFKIRGQYDF